MKPSLFWDVARHRLITVVLRHRSHLQGPSSPRRMRGTGGCVINIHTYSSLHNSYSWYYVNVKSCCLCAILLQWLHAVYQHCVSRSVGNTAWGQAVWIVAAFPSGYRLNARGIIVRYQAGARDFNYKTSRPALGLTKPPIQWAPRSLFSEVMLPQHKAVNSPPLSAED
jgi:hypothetical protein